MRAFPKSQVFFLVLLMLALVCLYAVAHYIKPVELFSDDENGGRWVLEHVDPTFGHSGVLIPVVRGGGVGSQVLVNTETTATPQPTTASPAVTTTAGPSGNNAINFLPGKAYTAKNGNIYYGDDIVNICGINWSGFESYNNVGSLQQLSIADNIALIKQYGFNAVRLTMHLGTMLNPDTEKPTNFSEAKNPELKEMSVGETMDKVVSLCAEAGILVMPAMYSLKLFTGDNPKVWYDADHPESMVLEGWKKITTRYRNYPNVFAMDILNEPHGSPGENDRATWGDGSANDFAKWCEKAGNAILEINPNLLISVGGIQYKLWGDDITGALTRPVQLKMPDKVFYTPHVYQLDPAWLKGGPEPTFMEYLDKIFGQAVKAGLTVVVGEYGYSVDQEQIDRDDGRKKYTTVASQQEFIEQLTQYCNSIGLTNAFYWEYTHDAGMANSIHTRDAASNTLSLVPGKLEQIKKLQSKKTDIKFVA